MRGRVSWWDIQIDDLAVAQRFYGEVLGGRFPDCCPDFVAASDGTEQVGELYESSEPVSGRGIRLQFDADDREGVWRRFRASAGG